MLNKMSDKIKEIIGLEKFDDIKSLIEADDKLSDDITLKHFVILMTCVLKDHVTFYQQTLLGEALHVK